MKKRSDHNLKNVSVKQRYYQASHVIEYIHMWNVEQGIWEIIGV